MVDLTTSWVCHLTQFMTIVSSHHTLGPISMTDFTDNLTLDQYQNVTLIHWKSK